MPILLDQIVIQTINGIVTGMILALVASRVPVQVRGLVLNGSAEIPSQSLHAEGIITVMFRAEQNP